MSLPDFYSSPIDLPFNRTSLAGQFKLETPGSDPGGASFWIVLRGSELIVSSTGSAVELPFAADRPVASNENPLYLGLWQGQPCRLIRMEKDCCLDAGLIGFDLDGKSELPIDLLSLGGLARQILHWEGNSRYCSRCGAAMQRLDEEWGKGCTGCKAQHYPHIHPCVIVIVRREGEILMTRKAEWPEGRYSLVAGFLDFSESLEEAAVREVMEETGIKIGNLRYVGSQGWPFPSQMMAGFVADYVSGEVKVEEKELEDAGWFSVDDLPLLPPKRSISRYLIDNYARI